MTDDTALYDTPSPRKPPPYPVSFEVEGPADVSRLSTGFRIILAIPLALFVSIVVGPGRSIQLQTGLRRLLGQNPSRRRQSE